MKKGKTRRVQVLPAIIIAAATFAVAFPVISSSPAWMEGHGEIVVAGLLLCLLVFLAIGRRISETTN